MRSRADERRRHAWLHCMHETEESDSDKQMERVRCYARPRYLGRQSVGCDAIVADEVPRRNRRRVHFYRWEECEKRFRDGLRWVRIYSRPCDDATHIRDNNIDPSLSALLAPLGVHQSKRPSCQFFRSGLSFGRHSSFAARHETVETGSRVQSSAAQPRSILSMSPRCVSSRLVDGSPASAKSASDGRAIEPDNRRRSTDVLEVADRGGRPLAGVMREEGGKGERYDDPRRLSVYVDGRCRDNWKGEAGATYSRNWISHRRRR